MRTVELSVDGAAVRCLIGFENPAGTAKWWGAYSWLRRLPSGARVTAWSSGGHGCAVALASDRLGLRATVAIPDDCRPDRLALLRSTGATLIVEKDLEAAHVAALGAEGIPVPGYDDVSMIEAHRALWWSSVVGDKPVFVPVGGGGLAASAVLELGVRAVAVQHLPATSLESSLMEGRPVRVDPGEVPVAVRVPKVGRVPLAIMQAVGVQTASVSAVEVDQALGELRSVGVLAESAGAIAVAAALGSGGGIALVSGGAPLEAGHGS